MLKKAGYTYLRLFEPCYIEQAKEWYYDTENATFFYEFGMMSNDDFASFVKMSNGMAFTIHDDRFDTKIPIGMVMVHDLKWKAKVASVGIMIEKEYRGQGHCKNAIFIVCDYLINELGIEKLVFETIGTNQRVDEILSADIKPEACLYNEAIFQGRRVNVVRYSVFKDEASKMIDAFFKKKRG